MDSFTVFDYIVLLIVICFVLLGAMRGLVKEIVSLVGWVFASCVSFFFGVEFARLLPQRLLGNDRIRLLIAYVILFLGVLLLVRLVGKVFRRLIKLGGLQSFDKFLGALFGFIKGTFIVLLLVLLCGFTGIPQLPLWKKAFFSPIAENAAKQLRPFLPIEFAQYIRY